MTTITWRRISPWAWEAAVATHGTTLGRDWGAVAGSWVPGVRITCRVWQAADGVHWHAGYAHPDEAVGSVILRERGFSMVGGVHGWARFPKCPAARRAVVRLVRKQFEERSKAND